jgi:SAM-dependent methyltransferase
MIWNLKKRPSADVPAYDKKAGRRALVKHLIARDTRILEIGALNSPTFRAKDAQVTIADWLPREELEAHYAKKKGIVDVDVVIEGDILNSVRKAELADFDIVIANHVIEHIPDVIGWLKQLSQITAEGRHLSMAVPDRRYTFDIVRTVSDVADLIDCHRQELTVPTFRQILKHLYFKKNVVARDVWGGALSDEVLAKKRFSLQAAVARAEEMEGAFHSMHCHVFTCDSFRQAMTELHEEGFISWKIENLVDVQPGSNEFLVLMKNASAK